MVLAHVSPPPAATPSAASRSEAGARHTTPRIGALAFDLDGTIYLGAQLLPGASALIEAIHASDVPYVFATNNSSRTGDAYVRHLAALGIPVTRRHVVTSNDVAMAHLHEVGWPRPYLLATPEVEAEYREHGIEPSEDDPDCVLLTFDTTLTYAKLRRAARLVREGRPYLATHPDRVCPTPEGPIPDCGAFIALLEAATGATPQVLGKPQPSMAGTIRERLERPPAEIAFVGDRLYTDVRMANEHGFFAVLTLTGETTRADLAGSEHVPDLVVESLTELREHLERTGVVGDRPRSSE